MKKSINIFWFRRDLRLEDNHAFFKALSNNLPVLPIFIFDKNILQDLPKNDARVTFIHDLVQQLSTTLQKQHNSGIAQFYDKPLAVFKQLTKIYNINSVYTNHDYEPYAIARDKSVNTFLNTNNSKFKTHKDHVIFETNDVLKKDNTPYKVFTPYSKQWLLKLNNEGISNYPSETLLNNCFKFENKPLALKTIGFTEAEVKIKPFHLSETLITNYEKTRNFPAQDTTSKIGPHLRFGTISVRKAVTKAQQNNNITYLKELIWREFFIHILWHFPKTITESFKPKYDAIVWRNNEEEFKKWCEGNTGYPLVDAGMRQLNQTGFMHNRVRMLVGSFLCKHLLIDWRLGEAYFAEKLHDYELASNVGNWQWVAGCGVDAAPYFRIFNPTTQIEKFDKELRYIKKWVPNFQELTYPTPMVDHKEARVRCLQVFKTALNKL